MMPTQQGSLQLFRLFGIHVYLHWSWFLVVLLEIQLRGRVYGTYFWNALEYLALFAIVLVHEFGHALACRQVGGRADKIVLWPLGGVAYVAPPQRPGAMLWSIAAGPLVNVVLAPILFALLFLAEAWNWDATLPNLYVFVRTLTLINLVLLVFNLMPVYPLDGGQILRSLLWFLFGRAHSLLIATIVGFVGVATLIVFAVRLGDIWLGIMAGFIVLNCWSGLMHARALLKLAKLPRRQGLSCPNCQSPPPMGALWICGQCRQPFDMFEHRGTCPNCGAQYAATMCLDCGTLSALPEWSGDQRQTEPQSRPAE